MDCVESLVIGRPGGLVGSAVHCPWRRPGLKKSWFSLHRIVTGTKAARRVRTWTRGLGVEMGKRDGRPAPQLFPSACPHGYRVTISIRKCHLALLCRERVSLLAVSGGMKKRSLQEKAALGRRNFFFFV